jgi:hypothetical protein
VSTDVFNVVNYEGTAGAGSDGGVELGDGGEVTAWENVTADEVVGFGIGFVSLFSLSAQLSQAIKNLAEGTGRDLQIQEW